MKKIRAAVVGYGNIGHFTVEALEAAPDFEIAGIVRRNANQAKPVELTDYEVVDDITKLKNVADGRVLERTFQVGFKLEDVRVERRPFQYLYEDTTGMILMNQETFEQIPVGKQKITGVDFMKESDIVEVVTDTSDGKILYFSKIILNFFTLLVSISQPKTSVKQFNSLCLSR